MNVIPGSTNDSFGRQGRNQIHNNIICNCFNKTAIYYNVTMECFLTENWESPAVVTDC